MTSELGQQNVSEAVVANTIDMQWNLVLDALRSEFDENTFKSWFKPLALINIEGNKAVMAAPTRFMRNWLLSNYAERLKNAWQRVNDGVNDIDIVVLSGFQGADKDIESPRAVATPTKGNNKEKPKSQMRVVNDGGFGAPLDPRFTFERFVVGQSNEFAYAAARRVAENKDVNFNPLFLHGGVGLGKTHLMHSIAWAIRENFPNKKVVYLSAEQFMYQFISAIRYKDTMAFKEKFRNVDLFMIDDLQFIANKNSTQDEFFHTFNALIDHNSQVILSADRSPSNLEGVEERIRSRLGSGLVADIHPTDFELRLGILQQKANSIPEVDIQSEVIEFLARRISSNVRELEGAFNRMVAHSTLIGRPITLEMTQEVLQDLLRANDRRVTVDEIQRQVADYFNIKLSDLLSARRARQVARPRQVAMYLSKQLTSKSLPSIGRKFGGRDHTTVMHAVKRIEELKQTDSVLEEDILHLERMFST
ncbi:MAG: chromosomal replication initiator protein DnaA [Emcibacteraceae bacterium]|nr:chromosomal replication initiator protein DnaA [Emcibacteraceae bacterium]MDG1997200.1 chromosomal replication initiator protein DnaA [Emcibacteraceae bacterium]